MNSSPDSSDADIPYEEISLGEVQRKYGLPKLSSAPDQPNPFSEVHTSDGSDNPDSCGTLALLQVITRANEVCESHVGLASGLAEQMQQVGRLWGGEAGRIGRLEEMVRGWLHRLDREAENGTVDRLKTSEWAKHEIAEVEIRWKERQRSQQQNYEHEIEGLRKQIELKEGTIRRLRKHRRVLRTCVRTLCESLLSRRHWTKSEKRDQRLFFLGHLNSVLDNPDDTDALNICRYMYAYMCGKV